ncbi:MAG: RNA methyltransferase [bacterium]|nr:RNA methyltransferase [bacterium]
MVITSLENDKVKLYVKLKDRKYRKKTNSFIVEGLHSVLEAYKSGNIIEMILEENEALPLDVPAVYVTQEIINKISSLDTPNKVMALCRMNEHNDIKGDKILLLDNIQDPGNLGTIIRSACAFNIDTIVLSKDTVDLYNPKVIRSTQGMIFHINIVIKDLNEVINSLIKNEIPIYGTRVEYGENVSYLKEKDKNKYAIIIGNEGNGVSRDILDKCDTFLDIDMNDKGESLNGAVATSILLYEMNK